ncbi:hypothetical protein D3C72_1394960 [compost metagenome]
MLVDLGLQAVVVEVGGRIDLAAAGQRDVLVAGEALHRDAVLAHHEGDELAEGHVLGVGVGILAVAAVDDLDAEGEVVDVGAALELGRTRVPGAIAVGDGLHDRAVLAHDVVARDLVRGVLEEAAHVLGGAAAGGVVQHDGVDLGAAAAVAVGRGHRDDRRLGDLAAADGLVGHVAEAVGLGVAGAGAADGLGLGQRQAQIQGVPGARLAQLEAIAVGVGRDLAVVRRLLGDAAALRILGSERHAELVDQTELAEAADGHDVTPTTG